MAVDEAQKLYAKAISVDRKALAMAQKKGDITGAERILRDAYETDVRPMLADWRQSKNLAGDPLTELRDSGVIDDLAKARTQARKDRGETQSSSYA